MTAAGLLRRRLTAQQLSGPPARDTVAVARRLLAVQAQDPRGARLAIRARSRGVTAADIDHALTEERSLLITWLNRGTLHLVCAEDYGWLHALTTPPLLAASTRRLAQEGLPPATAERAVSVMMRALGDEGPLGRRALRERLETAGIPVAGQALVHIFFRASIEGHVVRGPMAGSEHAYVLARDWLGGAARAGAASGVDRERALGELARRYLAGHAPATDRDLARWAGLPLRDARAGLAAIARELRETGDDDLIELRDRPRMASLPPPRLLGTFDPALVGWTSREWILGEHDAAVVTGGIFRAFALVAGRGVATWKLPADGSLAIEPRVAIAGDDLDALRRDGEAVTRFLGRR